MIYVKICDMAYSHLVLESLSQFIRTSSIPETHYLVIFKISKYTMKSSYQKHQGPTVYYIDVMMHYSHNSVKPPILHRKALITFI